MRLLLNPSGGGRCEFLMIAPPCGNSVVEKTLHAAPARESRREEKKPQPYPTSLSGTKAGNAAKRKSTGKRRPVARKPARPRQTFVASHLHATAFDEGLRSYAQYRDLGIKNATGGLVQAHVIRFLPPCRPEEVSKLHFHDVDFQMIYVLKGWIKSEFVDEGVYTFEVGSCWVQPPRIEHRVLDYSDDCEVLEIIMPAEFDTVTLD